MPTMPYNEENDMVDIFKEWAVTNFYIEKDAHHHHHCLISSIRW
jgi:hypothetical protein